MGPIQLPAIIYCVQATAGQVGSLCCQKRHILYLCKGRGSRQEGGPVTTQPGDGKKTPEDTQSGAPGLLTKKWAQFNTLWEEPGQRGELSTRNTNMNDRGASSEWLQRRGKGGRQDEVRSQETLSSVASFMRQMLTGASACQAQQGVLEL